MNTHNTITEPATLLNDILDPARSVLDICADHALSFTDLIHFLEGPIYAALANAARQLSRARAEMLTLEITPQAIAALHSAIDPDPDPESRALNETIRKAATKLLTIARQNATANPGGPARRAGAPPHEEPPASPAPADEVPSPRGGDGPPPNQPVTPNPPRTPETATLSSPAPAGEVSRRSRDGGGLPPNHPSTSLHTQTTTPPQTHATQAVTTRRRQARSTKPTAAALIATAGTTTPFAAYTAPARAPPSSPQKINATPDSPPLDANSPEFRRFYWSFSM